jgi:hypothetical protein
MGCTTRVYEEEMKKKIKTGSTKRTRKRQTSLAWTRWSNTGLFKASKTVGHAALQPVPNPSPMELQ